MSIELLDKTKTGLRKFKELPDQQGFKRDEKFYLKIKEIRIMDEYGSALGANAVELPQGDLVTVEDHDLVEPVKYKVYVTRARLND